MTHREIAPTSASDDVSIAKVEAAINVWRNLSPAPVENDEPLILCAEARILADVYGVMIVRRLASVPLSSLTAAQRKALACATE
ncbi:DUF3717 domain-containing protein [Burkholderia sp. Ac-20353]|uniref:DUF3717 domain-containing protein n=1 Tax=Burkholderia sp. Ac-20353 TaxID=2703894 RepID=UPI00197C4691|nr:DUF3717 domain-containing protein [Burkholderia sp. Ac-20353]MBN3785660.1 DUF3717 domain-containing protein [Burkholderia sp. Ac-20353]